MNNLEADAYFDQCLEQCKVKLALAGPKIQARSAKTLPIDRDELNAAIMGDAIVGFLDGMTRRNKGIVKKTYAYAAITSKILHPGEHERVARYDVFLKLMFSMGWTEYYGAMTQHTSSSASLTMDNVALDIVHSALGGVAGAAANTMKLVADKTIEALKKQPEAVKLFEHNATDGKGINFGVAMCKQDKDEEVTMVVGTVSCNTSAPTTKVLFVEWKSADLDMYQGKAHFTIHEEDFRQEAKINKFLDGLREIIFMEFSPV